MDSLYISREAGRFVADDFHFSGGDGRVVIRGR